MARLLLLVIIGLLGWLLVKKLTSALSKSSRKPSEDRPAPPVAEDMVPCRHCGVNLPRSDARLVEGAYECADRAQCGHRT